MIPNALILALCSVRPFSLLPLSVTSLGSCPSPRCSLSSGCCRHGSLKTLCVILLFLTVVAPSLVAVSLAAARRLAEGKEAVLSTRLFLLLVRLKDLAGLVKKWQKISRRRSSTRSEISDSMPSMRLSYRGELTLSLCLPLFSLDVLWVVTGHQRGVQGKSASSSLLD